MHPLVPKHRYLMSMKTKHDKTLRDVQSKGHTKADWIQNTHTHFPTQLTGHRRLATVSDVLTMRQHTASQKTGALAGSESVP